MDHLDIITDFSKSKLRFLLDCGFTLSENYIAHSYTNKHTYYVIYYRSLSKLIEIAFNANGDNIECVIRKITSNEVASYNDSINCLIGYQLKYLTDNIDYDNITLSGFNLQDHKEVINNYVELLLNNKKTVCNEDWFDIDKIKKNQEKEYLKKWGIPVVIPVNTLHNMLIIKSTFLLTLGYKLIEDSNLLPPYQRLSWHIIYSRGTDIINIHQEDWRDAYNSYVITINNKDIFKASIGLYRSMDEMIDHFVYNLKEAI